jgi:3-dehydroquinate dehydratase-2
MLQISIINGPNLNQIGKREQDIYGDLSFEDFLKKLKKKYNTVDFLYFQSNCEGALIDQIQQNEREKVAGIILNAGAYTHTSIALLDAIRNIEVPVVEVHLSNIYARESYRHHSMLAAACVGQITGFGLKSYELALLYWLNKQEKEND